MEYNKLFDQQTVETIFSNAQQICNFQRDFLRELEASVNHDKMEESQIGQVFVQNVSPDSIYTYVYTYTYTEHNIFLPCALLSTLY